MGYNIKSKHNSCNRVYARWPLLNTGKSL